MHLILIVLAAAFLFKWIDKRWQRYLYNRLRNQIMIRATVHNQTYYRMRIKSSGLDVADKLLLYQFLNQTIEAVGYESAGVI